MLVAQKLKNTNIAEYLLYMWQVEDLMRAYGLDIDAVNHKIVEKYPDISPQERHQIYEWYESIIEMMRVENVQQNGHIQLNKNTVSEICEFHALLLQSGKSPAYNAKFFYILPVISTLRRKLTDDASDIEICFNFMYGIMTLSMKKQEISPETRQSQTEIAKFLFLLSENYNLYSSGELKLD
jgi:hypothetical protein